MLLSCGEDTQPPSLFFRGCRSSSTAHGSRRQKVHARTEIKKDARTWHNTIYNEIHLKMCALMFSRDFDNSNFRFLKVNFLTAAAVATKAHGAVFFGDRLRIYSPSHFLIRPGPSEVADMQRLRRGRNHTKCMLIFLPTIMLSQCCLKSPAAQAVKAAEFLDAVTKLLHCNNAIFAQPFLSLFPARVKKYSLLLPACCLLQWE